MNKQAASDRLIALLRISPPGRWDTVEDVNASRESALSFVRAGGLARNQVREVMGLPRTGEAWGDDLIPEGVA